MSNFKQPSKINLDNSNKEERHILAQMRTRAQRDVSRPSTPETNDVEMSTHVPSPQMMRAAAALESAPTDRVEGVQVSLGVSWGWKTRGSEVACPPGSKTTSTSTDITNAALDKKVAHFHRRLEEIDSKHTKALESHAEEVNELVLVCSKEMKQIEGDTETVSGIVTRAEERMKQRLGKMESRLEKQAKL
ncbi:hypothetical protein CEP54_000153 [Fusarium duplospermum]|uniref:Uncharacterized protein n=1 Tax=Fusarium duplospermum TaxID=1325734 RepID=A0A428R8A3_9HYPO|nr:hypothetical protein CEP54_000153 [Fusarium duplospermum]